MRLACGQSLSLLSIIDDLSNLSFTGNITSTMDGTADEGGNPTNVASTYQNDVSVLTES